MRLPFFVYGTLRPGQRNHDAFLRGRIRTERPARLMDAVLYDGPGYPYAVEEPGGTVHGDLVTAHPDVHDELLAELDRLEECTPGGDPRDLYARVRREVVLDDGQRTPAWVYLAAPAVEARLRAHGRRIESGDWTDRA